MTHSCEIAEAIPRSTPTGEFARGQCRVGGYDGHPGAAVLLQSCSAGPGRRARPRPSRQARRLALRCYPRRAAQRFACDLHDRPGPRRRAWPEPQACHQTGGSPALQPDDQRRRYSRSLGALRRRRTQRHRGGIGLDRFRRRQASHHHVVSDLRPWSCHTPGVADRRQVHAQEQPQPLRASRVAAACRTAAAGRQGMRCRRPRLRRPKTSTRC